MLAVRRIIALLILGFIGLPILFGVIWVVGLTKATVSAEFVSDLPLEIIQDVPEMADEIFEAAQDEMVVTDEETRAWFRAAAEAGLSPRQVMEDSGLLDWLKNELSESLAQVGDIFRGEERPSRVVFDLRPLKEILESEETEALFLRIVEHLPPCDEEGAGLWAEIAERGGDVEDIPPCRPDLEVARSVFAAWRADALETMEDEIDVFDVEEVPVLPLGLSRTVTLISSFLFVIPAVIIFLSSLIAATSPASFFRWSGISVFVGGLPALALSFFAKHASLWALKFGPYAYTETWSPELHDLILEKTSWIPMVIMDRLLSPVIAVAGIVCIVGVLLFAVSLLVRK